MQQAGLAFQVGYMAARRVFDDPGEIAQQATFQHHHAQYDLLWAYYNSAMFDKTYQLYNGANWQAYKSVYNLYRNIRLIYNPTRRLADFYAGTIYPGMLSEDGASLPDGVPLAIPLSRDTDPALKAAIAQLWTWSNWQAKKAVEVRYGAALGSVLVEIIDDVERGKVCADLVWPGHVYALTLDNAGNVKSYALQYQAYDEAGMYIYRKEVDQTGFRYYRNGEPFDYGYGTEVENPYGFVPAIWIKHKDTGGLHGSPAIAGSFGKIDELNNLASHTHDHIHKVIGAPLMLWSTGSIQNLFNAQKRGPTTDFIEPSSDQENVLMLKGPAGGKVESLAGNLSLADAAMLMDKLLSEIEQDHPELALYRELRAMSQVTGPAASRLVGDVSSRVFEAQAMYDQANISLFRMMVAIAGMRANSGVWGTTLSRQQQKFLSFSLDSYARGDLDMAILPRPLLEPTKLELALERESTWRGVKMAADGGVPATVVLRAEGWTEEQLGQLGDEKVAQIKRDQMLANEDVIPMVTQ